MVVLVRWQESIELIYHIQYCQGSIHKYICYMPVTINCCLPPIWCDYFLTGGYKNILILATLTRHLVIEHN